jgi:hypothetical protein
LLQDGRIRIRINNDKSGSKNIWILRIGIHNTASNSAEIQTIKNRRSGCQYEKARKKTFYLDTRYSHKDREQNENNDPF